MYIAIRNICLFRIFLISNLWHGCGIALVLPTPSGAYAVGIQTVEVLDSCRKALRGHNQKKWMIALSHLKDMFKKNISVVDQKKAILIEDHSFSENAAHILGFQAPRIASIVNIHSKITDLLIFKYKNISKNISEKSVRGAFQHQIDVGNTLKKVLNSFSDDAYRSRYITECTIPGVSSDFSNWILKQGPHFSSIDTRVEGYEISAWSVYLKKITTWLKNFFSTKPLSTACTDAKCALDKILHIPDDNKAWGELLEYIQTWPHTRPTEPLRYSDIMTSAFIYGWSSLEQKTVGKDGYKEGYVCGLDFILFTYSQDVCSHYVYRTLQSCIHQSLIESYPPSSPKHIVQYRMVCQKGVWKLDGCCNKSIERIAKYDVNLTPDELDCALCTS